jgi:hypothetical protein
VPLLGGAGDFPLLQEAPLGGFASESERVAKVPLR